MNKQGKVMCIFMALFITSYLMLLPIRVFADNLKEDVKTLINKHGPGIDVVVTGKALPKGALAEWRRAALAIKAARIQLRRLVRRAERIGENPDYAIRFMSRLDRISQDLNILQNDTRMKDAKLMGHLGIVTAELMHIQTSCLEMTKEMGRLWNALKNKKEKDEGWSFGLSAYGSSEWAITKQDLMPIGGLGLTTSWRKETLSFNLMLGAGVSVINDAALSWTFISDLAFILHPKLTVGPALVMTQDLGNMEGADRWVWEAGCKVKSNAFGVDIWAIPAIGIHGERGYGAGTPTYSPNIGITVGIDYLLLK